MTYRVFVEGDKQKKASIHYTLIFHHVICLEAVKNVWHFDGVYFFFHHEREKKVLNLNLDFGR